MFDTQVNQENRTSDTTPVDNALVSRFAVLCFHSLYPRFQSVHLHSPAISVAYCDSFLRNSGDSFHFTWFKLRMSEDLFAPVSVTKVGLPYEPPDVQTLRVMSWNIERGYSVEALVEEIKAVNPEILLLQEVDKGNKRTSEKDIADEIATALGMQYILYGIEFIEIESARRSKLLQGGGSHGNAIISRFPIDHPKVFELPQAYNWENSLRKPRRGSLSLILPYTCA